MIADEDLHRHAVENLARADALLFGRVTYEMMEAAWRRPARAGARPNWMEPFARTIDAAKKYVVSSTLDRVDWNAELMRGDLGKAVRQLKGESGKGLLVGGVKLPLALAELGLIDEYEFVVQPRLAGHGPTLFAGLSKRVDLKLVSRLDFGSGAVAMRYDPKFVHRRGESETMAYQARSRSFDRSRRYCIIAVVVRLTQLGGCLWTQLMAASVSHTLLLIKCSSL
jgi:dihydrofolate reductase